MIGIIIFVVIFAAVAFLILFAAKVLHDDWKGL